MADISYRPAVARVRDWNEIYKAWPHESALKQAKRCLDCGVPLCQGERGCPLGNVIPEWNELAARGRWQDALARLHATNNFPEFTGRLCPAPCESVCVQGLHSDPVTIKSLEWTIVQRGYENGWIQPQKPAASTGFSVSIVGSGPAGLAAAQQLVRDGHAVTVFEKHANPGGLLRYGIPDFKFEKWQVERRIRQLEAEGVLFRTSVTVGVDIELAALRASFDAVALTIGCETPRDLSIPGRRGLKGVHFAMDYLVERNKIQSREQSTPPAISCAGKDVIILGGGDTGSDCLGTALREGAKSVRQIEMLAKPTPIRSSHAHEEGGQREWNMKTMEFIGEGSQVREILGVSNDARDSVPTIRLPADVVLLAIGFTSPIVQPLLGDLKIALDTRGNILTSADYKTSLAGVYAAGDARRGASLIVWAIAEGRALARAVNVGLSR